MDNIVWQIILATVGLLIPIGAFVWEFVFIGRKHLGYRIQMDTTAVDEVTSQGAGAWQHMLQRENGPWLVDPSFVLLRIENIGTTNIDEPDYNVLNHNRVGVRVSFPGRKVVGMAVTEISSGIPRDNFGPDSGLGVRSGEDEISGRVLSEIELPKVPLNRNQHYKVLALLERASDDESSRQGLFDKPKLSGGVKGGVGDGGIKETESQSGTPRRVMALIYLLVFVILAEPAASSLLFGGNTAPLDCASGRLTVVGSTAFESTLREAADLYQETCPDAEVTIETQGSDRGLETLNAAGQRAGGQLPNMLAFSDGPKRDGFPMLLPRPIAFSLFTLVINKEAGVADLSEQQIRQIYNEELITNWEELGGNDVPVRIVDRESDSGTRRTFEQQVLRRPEPGENSADCLNRASGAPGAVVRCRKDSTTEVLDAVERTPGAIGYSELGTAMDKDDLQLVRIGGQEASPDAAEDGTYFFGETEFAYTYGEPSADSPAAGFLRYLTTQVGQDIVRQHEHQPCAELPNPSSCRPPAARTTPAVVPSRTP